MPYVKFTVEDVLEMVAMRARGLTFQCIAEHFRTSAVYAASLVKEGPEVRAKKLAGYREREEARERERQEMMECRERQKHELAETRRLISYSRRLSQEQRVKIRELWGTRRYSVADIVDEVKATWRAVSKYIDSLASEIVTPIKNDSGIVLLGCRVCNGNIEYQLPKGEVSMARIAYANGFVECGRCGQSFLVKLLLSAAEFSAEWDRVNGVDRQYRDDVVLYRFGRLI